MQKAQNNGHQLASIAAMMYLVNLLLLPGIALGALIWMRSRYAASSPPLAVYHLRLAINASLIAILIIAGGSAVLWLLFSHSATGISMVLLYAITSHTFCVLWGIFCLARAMSGKYVGKHG